MPDRFDRAIIIGDACVDVHIALNDLIHADPNRALPYHINTGGTSAGTAVALAKLETPTAFLGTVGEDFGGRFILDELKRLDIDTELMIVADDLNTVNVFAFINDEGERYLWGFPRVDHAYSQLDFERIDIDKIRKASWLHSSGMTLLAKGSIRQSLPKLFQIAYEAGVPTSFDLNTRVNDLSLLDEEAVEAIRKTLPYVKYLTGSARDEFVSFHPGEDWKDSVCFFADEDHFVIARDGINGFLVIENGKEYSWPSYDVEVKDTTGAGDSFNAGLICSLLEGKDLFEAAKFANAVSGYKISGHEINKDAVTAFMKNTALRSNE